MDSFDSPPPPIAGTRLTETSSGDWVDQVSGDSFSELMDGTWQDNDSGSIWDQGGNLVVGFGTTTQGQSTPVVVPVTKVTTGSSQPTGSTGILSLLQPLITVGATDLAKATGVNATVKSPGTVATTVPTIAGSSSTLIVFGILTVLVILAAVIADKK